MNHEKSFLFSSSFVYFVVYNLLSFQGKEPGYEPRKARKGELKVNDILFKEESFAIQGAVFEVYKELGSGFLESVYQECLEKELLCRNIPFQSQVEIRINYKGHCLNNFFKADLICYESILVELKACRVFEPIHRAQVMNYLRATGLRLGLLVNFSAHPKVEIERIVL